MSFAVDYIYRENVPVLGLAVAVEAFMKAWFRHSAQPQFLCHAQDPKAFLRFAESARAYAPAKNCVHINPTLGASELKKISTLFVPDPDLTEVVWRRAKLSGAAHAICGLVHSMSGDQVTRAVADLCLAPTNGADALICPSRAIRDAVRRVWDIQTDYLNKRFNASFSCPVQTPVIPLGIDTADFAARATPEHRAKQRAALGAGDDEVIILFVGRLNFATKAHPLPLILAAEKAAKESQKKIRLVLFGTFQGKADMEARFRALLQDFGTSLNCQIITNDDPCFPQGLWAGADIFASLVDNIQESFGLTPIEAMACGLPAVVSDWDGYRDGVRHGLDGFLIPTYAPPPDIGMDIAEAYFNDRHYGRYLVGASQSTAIDIDAAAKAFVALADNPARRVDMGRQAQARARAMYDWRVIIQAYEQLWAKLAEDRLRFSASPALPSNWQAVAPHYPNPLRVFESFPSATLAENDILVPMADSGILKKLLRHDMNLFAPNLLLPPPLIEGLLEAIRANGGLRIAALLAVTPESERPRLWRTVGWLVKHGLCRKEKA